MTATIHRIEPRPASRQLEQWRIDMFNEKLPPEQRLHAGDMATIFGDDLDEHDATAVRNVILAEQREAEADAYRVQHVRPAEAAEALAEGIRRLAWIAIAVVLFGAVAAWGETVMTKAAAHVLAAEDRGMW